MNELKALFESALLNDETKTAIKEALDNAVKAKAVELEATYVTQLEEAEKNILAEIPSMIEEAVAEELASLTEEVANARTLEVSYAEKLTAFKEAYAEKNDELLRVMVAESVAEEIDELKEDIELAKKHEFVMSMFESFKGTYERLFGESDISVHDKLNEAYEKLDQYQRKETIDSLLEGLVGDKRKIAETILEGVATDKLESKFDGIKSVLLAESDKPSKDPVIEEGKNEKEIPDGKIVLENVENDKTTSKPVVDPMLIRLQESIKLGRGR